MGHGNVALFVNALDGIRKIALVSQENDAESHTNNENEAYDRDPQDMGRLRPPVHNILLWQRFPNKLKKKLQDEVIDVSRNTTNDSDHNR
jgi:hypothetical protein